MLVHSQFVYVHVDIVRDGSLDSCLFAFLEPCVDLGL